MPRGADPLEPSAGGMLRCRITGTTCRNFPYARPIRFRTDSIGRWCRGRTGRSLQTMGFHPFVSPAASPRLQTCPVPLAVEPSSYELARRYLERNEWPPADRVRTEEFLAAVDYNFPKPKHQGLGLIVAGGPSPISGEGFCLLQVGVQARQTEHAKHAPLHLVLLIDTSTSMRWGSRMEIVRRALRRLAGDRRPAGSAVAGDVQSGRARAGGESESAMPCRSLRRPPIPSPPRVRRISSAGCARPMAWHGRRSVPGGPRCGSCC